MMNQQLSIQVSFDVAGNPVLRVNAQPGQSDAPILITNVDEDDDQDQTWPAHQATRFNQGITIIDTRTVRVAGEPHNMSITRDKHMLKIRYTGGEKSDRPATFRPATFHDQIGPALEHVLHMLIDALELGHKVSIQFDYDTISTSH